MVYPVFSWEEIRKVLVHLPANKAPGPNGLPGDLLKSRVDLWAPVSRYLNATLRKGIPESWASSVIDLIFKKGYRYSTSCYCPISLNDVEVKIVGRVILNRLQAWATDQNI